MALCSSLRRLGPMDAVHLEVVPSRGLFRKKQEIFGINSGILGLNNVRSMDINL